MPRTRQGKEIMYNNNVKAPKYDDYGIGDKVVEQMNKEIREGKDWRVRIKEGE